MQTQPKIAEKNPRVIAEEIIDTKAADMGRDGLFDFSDLSYDQQCQSNANEVRLACALSEQSSFSMLDIKNGFKAFNVAPYRHDPAKFDYFRELLERQGIVKSLGSGKYTFTPLGKEVVREFKAMFEIQPNGMVHKDPSEVVTAAYNAESLRTKIKIESKAAKAVEEEQAKPRQAEAAKAVKKAPPKLSLAEQLVDELHGIINWEVERQVPGSPDLTGREQSQSVGGEVQTIVALSKKPYFKSGSVDYLYGKFGVPEYKSENQQIQHLPETLLGRGMIHSTGQGEYYFTPVGYTVVEELKQMFGIQPDGTMKKDPSQVTTAVWEKGHPAPQTTHVPNPGGLTR